MKIRISTTLALVALLTCLVANTQATTFNFDGHSSNEDIPQFYGSNVAAETAEFITTDGTGATPNIGVTWFPAGGFDEGTTDVLEFHNSGNFNLTHISPGVAQFDLDASQHPTANPEDPEIEFTPAAGIAVVINSLGIGQALDQGEPDYDWTITVRQSSDDAVVFTHTTAVMGAGDSEFVPINFTGALGAAYYLHFDDGGADTVRGAIDNLSFSQIPEPSTLALVALCGLGVVARRRR